MPTNNARPIAQFSFVAPHSLRRSLRSSGNAPHGRCLLDWNNHHRKIGDTAVVSFRQHSARRSRLHVERLGRRCPRFESARSASAFATFVLVLALSSSRKLARLRFDWITRRHSRAYSRGARIFLFASEAQCQRHSGCFIYSPSGRRSFSFLVRLTRFF